MQRALLLLALSHSVVACGAPEESLQQTADATERPSATLSFDAAWNESLTGPLVAGGSLTVAYDPARLAQCQGVQGGVLQWAITGHRRLSGGAVVSFDVISPNHPSGDPVSFDLAEPGSLELWFEATNKWGCHAWDSDFGANYRYEVGSPASYPSWAGNAVTAIARWSCGGGPCADDLLPASDGFLFDTWARQRATIAAAYFEAWEPGITDWDNPDLWKMLDVQMHYRFDPAMPYTARYVDFELRNGNNARYSVSIRKLDPLGGNTITDPADCPDVPLQITENGAYVRTTMEYYFTVSDVTIRPAAGEVYEGVFEDYSGLYGPCL